MNQQLPEPKNHVAEHKDGRRRAHLIADDGEVLDLSGLQLVSNRRRPSVPDFIMVFQGGILVEEALKNGLSFTAFKLFWILCKMVPMAGSEEVDGTYFTVNQAAIADRMNVDRSNLNKALKELESYELIHRGPRVGAHWTFRVDKREAFRGSGDVYHGRRPRRKAATPAG